MQLNPHIKRKTHVAGHIQEGILNQCEHHYEMTQILRVLHFPLKKSEHAGINKISVPFKDIYIYIREASSQMHLLGEKNLCDLGGKNPKHRVLFHGKYICTAL